MGTITIYEEILVPKENDLVKTGQRQSLPSACEASPRSDLAWRADFRMDGLLLHELGHQFGLCDQYGAKPNPTAHHENCDAKIRSLLPAASVMNSNRPGRLLPHDRLAIRILACLRENQEAWLSKEVVQAFGQDGAPYRSFYKEQIDAKEAMADRVQAEYQTYESFQDVLRFLQDHADVKIQAPCLSVLGL